MTQLLDHDALSPSCRNPILPLFHQGIPGRKGSFSSCMLPKGNVFLRASAKKDEIALASANLQPAIHRETRGICLHFIIAADDRVVEWPMESDWAMRRFRPERRVSHAGKSTRKQTRSKTGLCG